MFYPLLFKPVYKEHVWGGRSLETKYNRLLPENTFVGESWEITCRGEGISIIDNGHFKGKTLQELIEKYTKEVVGEKFAGSKSGFPLLIKIIDANSNLSVQVHPGGDDGKTEAWYVLEAEKGSKIIYGFKDGIDKDIFTKSIVDNEVENVLREIEVKPGDMIFIPAGTVHSLSKGIIVLEVQQNSNTTYRIFDWNRLGLDGKPRELHIEEALSAIDFDSNVNRLIKDQPETDTCSCQKLVDCTYFSVDKLQINGEKKYFLDGDKFEILVSIDGAFDIRYGNEDQENIHIESMQTVMLPAMLGKYSISGQCKLLKICPNKDVVVEEDFRSL